MKYRKLPVVIDAVRYMGNNLNECRDFITGQNGKLINRRIRIKTLEGTIFASEGDYIIKGVNGEFYPCKPDIFEKTYEPVNQD